MAVRGTWRNGIGAVALLALLTTQAGCNRRAGPPPSSLAGYNLIFINIDTLRADHLASYGYPRKTSPFLDSLAAQGVLFERAHANSSYTKESVAALMSGRLPSSSGSLGWWAHPFDDERNLGHWLEAAGYRTGFFSLSMVLDHPQFYAGFDEAAQLSNEWGLSRAGPRLTARALEFARAAGGKKFMMYLHYLDPHGPYDPPEELLHRFLPVPFPYPLDVYGNVRSNLELLVRHGFAPGDIRFEDMVARYDAEILDTDRTIASLFEGLRELGVLDRTLVIVSADHGEEFLDHGFVEHAWTLYQESLHVPLIVWAPGRLPALRVATRVSVVDYLPTILSLLEIEHDVREFDGKALLAAHGDTFVPAGPPGPVIAELLIPERSVLRAILQDDWKYIAAQRWLVPEQRPAAIRVEEKLHAQGESPAFDVWGPVIHEELFRLSDDPRERRDLSAAEPGRRARFRELLEGYRRRCAAGPASRRPVEQPTAEDLEKLRSLGYVN